MRLKAYIRLQKCTTSDRLMFVSRHQESHGIARGVIDYYAVEAESWAGARRVLKTFDVMGFTNLMPETACAWCMDIGSAPGRLYRLVEGEVPEEAKWSPELARRLRAGLIPRGSVELTSFGVQAVEVMDPNVQQPPIVEPVR